MTHDLRVLKHGDGYLAFCTCRWTATDVRDAEAELRDDFDGHLSSLRSRESVTWRYLPRGRVRHAVGFCSTRVTGHDRFAMCGLEPWVDTTWLGTGSQAEYDRVAAMPECRRCADRLTPREEGS